MKQLKDYKWLCSEFRIKQVIIDNASYKKVSENKIISGFITQLIGMYILESDVMLKVDGEEQCGMSCLGIKVGDYLKK